MDMVEAFPWMPLLFDMMAGSVTDQLTRPKMDVHRSLEAAGLGLVEKLENGNQVIRNQIGRQ